MEIEQDIELGIGENVCECQHYADEEVKRMVSNGTTHCSACQRKFSYRYSCGCCQENFNANLFELVTWALILFCMFGVEYEKSYFPQQYDQREWIMFVIGTILHGVTMLMVLGAKVDLRNNDSIFNKWIDKIERTATTLYRGYSLGVWWALATYIMQIIGILMTSIQYLDGASTDKHGHFNIISLGVGAFVVLVPVYLIILCIAIYVYIVNFVRACRYNLVQVN